MSAEHETGIFIFAESRVSHNMTHAKRLGDEIDSFRSAAGDNDLIGSDAVGLGYHLFQ